MEQNEQRRDRVLRTASNGMQVWVPVDRLEAWEKAQADQSPEAEERRSSRSSKILSALRSLHEQAQKR